MTYGKMQAGLMLADMFFELENRLYGALFWRDLVRALRATGWSETGCGVWSPPHQLCPEDAFRVLRGIVTPSCDRVIPEEMAGALVELPVFRRDQDTGAAWVIA